MNIIHTRKKSVTAALGVAVAGVATSALLFLGAGTSHATDFDPQPDPPRLSNAFDPSPGLRGSVVGR